MSIQKKQYSHGPGSKRGPQESGLLDVHKKRSIDTSIFPGWPSKSPLKILAHKRDIPYRSLVKLFLGREILVERRALDSS